MKARKAVLATFEQAYGTGPNVRIARAPGRVNLIGEHTDYQEGFVLPIAIEQAIYVAFAPRNDSTVNVVSVDFHGRDTFDLSDPIQPRDPRWLVYPMGVASVLKGERIRLGGMDLAIAGDVPVGAGLSSSAALQVACAVAMSAAAEVQIEPTRLAVLARKAENEFAGVPCGIMDPFISVHGKTGCAVKLDCRSLEFEQVPLPTDHMVLVVINTNKPHELHINDYALRQAECRDALAIVRKDFPQIETLRDVTEKMFRKVRPKMLPVTKRRCRHVVGENARVLDSVVALTAGDVETFGSLMNQSHDSLRDDFEVSCKELDVLVKIARGVKGVYGSRMTGGGFGGCTITAAAPEAVEPLRASIMDKYPAATNLQPDFYVVQAAEGAGLIQ